MCAVQRLAQCCTENIWEVTKEAGPMQTSDNWQEYKNRKSQFVVLHLVIFADLVDVNDLR